MAEPQEAPGLSEETLSVLEGEVKKGKVRKFFLISRGSAIRTVGVFKKGQFGTRVNEAKKAGFKGDVAYGVVTGSGKNLTFQFAGNPEVAEAMNVDGFADSIPVKEVKLKEFFSDNGLDVKVELQCVTNVAQALVPTADEDNNSPTSSSPPPPPTPSPVVSAGNVDAGNNADVSEQVEAGSAADPRKAKLEEALRTLVPKIKQAVADFPARKADLLGPVAAIKQKLESNELDAAKQGISSVATLLKQLSETKGAGSGSDQTAPVPVPSEYSQLMESVRPKYDRALAEKLGDYEKFKKLMLFADEKATAGDFVSAQRALDGLAKALDAALASPIAGSGDPSVSLFELSKSRLEFESLHRQAILASEQTRDEILEEFQDDAEQAIQLERAIATMNAKIADLRTNLNEQLDLVVQAQPNDRGRFAQAVRKQVNQFLDFLDTDEVMANLDGNEFLPNTNVIEPLKSKLDDIASLLEKVAV